MANAPNERLQQARLRAGYETAVDAARAFGWNENTYYSHENGTRGIRKGAAEQYGRAFRVPPTWILFGGELEDTAIARGERAKSLPIVGEVAAGLWREVDNWDETPYGSVPFVPDSFPKAEHRAYRVVGNSVDRLGILDGDTIVTVDYWTVRREPREGDLVLVERRRGSLIERTCKQVVLKRDSVELWPRSSDPRYQAPIVVPRNRQADDETVEIVGLIISVQRSFSYR